MCQHGANCKDVAVSTIYHPRHRPRLRLLTTVLWQALRTEPQHSTEDLVRLTVPARCTRGGQIRPGEEPIQDVSRIHPHPSALPPTRGKERGSARPHQERHDPGPASGRGEALWRCGRTTTSPLRREKERCSRKSLTPRHLVFNPPANAMSRRSKKVATIRANKGACVS